MRDLLTTSDSVVISYATSLLESDGIGSVVLDQNISGVEAGIGAFPRRLVVVEEDWVNAARLLEDAGLGAWINRDA